MRLSANCDEAFMLIHRDRRRWFQFSLRGLFFVVTAIGLWLGWATHWMRERQTLRDLGREGSLFTGELTRAPSGLWMLGETGYREIQVLAEHSDDNAALIEKTRALYPEAQVGCLDYLRWAGAGEAGWR